MAFHWERYIPEMDRLWSSMKIIRDAAQLERVEKKIRLHQAVYQKVQDATGVPWQMVAVIHLREAGESDIGKWKGVLHNGEKIVGTGKKTRIVPIGRGPFNTWHDAAVHALKEKKFHLFKNWTPGAMLAALEPYNGYGYRGKGLRSPYIWASTNHQQRGKYVRDHVFDPSVMDTQVGCAAQLRFLGVGARPTSVPAVVRDTAGVGAVVGPAAMVFTDYIIPILIVGGLVLGTIWVYRYFNRNK
jgi:lysozyme family protein